MYFPHFDAIRAVCDDPASLKKECPVLLDPVSDEEARLISYEYRDEETCEAVPAADISSEELIRVKRTIEVLGLNRIPRLNQKRAQLWDTCKMHIADYRGAKGPLHSVKLQRAQAKLKLRAMVDYDSEFSSVAEACVRKNAPEPLLAAVASSV